MAKDVRQGSEDFTRDICVDCGLFITDGSDILGAGVDRICSRCAMFRKKMRGVNNNAFKFGEAA